MRDTILLANSTDSQLFTRHLLSASADCSGAMWDVEHVKRVKRFGEHTAVVNSISSGTHATSKTVVTASDDGTAKVHSSFISDHRLCTYWLILIGLGYSCEGVCNDNSPPRPIDLNCV